MTETDLSDLPSDGLALLEAAIRVLQAEDPAGCAPAVALDRTARVLRLQEQLRAVTLSAVGDVDVRELFALDFCASTRGWLRTQTCGDHGQLAAARRLRDYPVIAEAVARGRLGQTGTDQLCTALRQIDQLTGPDPTGQRRPVGEDQILGVLIHGIPGMLAPWAGTGLTGSDLTETHLDRRAELAEALTTAANQSAASPAVRLEPVLALLGHALPPAELPGALSQLVGALQPEQLDATADDQHTRTYLKLLRRSDGMWDLSGLLDEHTGTLLKTELANRRRQARADAARHAADTAERLAQEQADEAQDSADTADTHAGLDALPADITDDAERFGRVGPGLPPLPLGPLTGPLGEAPVFEGEVSRSYAQQDADAIRILLDDLTGIAPNSGTPSPAQLTVVISQAALHDEPGALPGQLQTPLGPVPIGPETARRLHCEGQHATVTLADSHLPIGASGEHRHATRRERRALHAQWGLSCAVNGCTQPGAIPHHTEPFWKTGRTQLKDLVPICRSHHHDVHEGHRTLRLRNGRLINHQGWAIPQPAAA